MIPEALDSLDKDGLKPLVLELVVRNAALIAQNSEDPSNYGAIASKPPCILFFDDEMNE